MDLLLPTTEAPVGGDAGAAQGLRRGVGFRLLKLVTVAMDEALPAEPVGVAYGRLANGLTYYVRSNPKPCKCAALSLAIKNGTKDSISKLVSDLNAVTLENDVDVVVAPPFIYIDQVKNSLTDRIEVSTQNVWIGKGRAFTGEISAEQLVDIGCKWVILGHSEHRHVIGEDDQFIGKKAAYALSQNVKVIACIGELLEEREARKTFDVCFKQMKAFTNSITNWVDVVIAYEPVWAIGIGKVATPDQAQEVHAAVRDWLETNVSPKVASTIRIIYGDGSSESGSSNNLVLQAPQPIRKDYIQNAVKFLAHPKVKGSPVFYRRSFLEKKGIMKEEIDEACRRNPQPNSSSTDAAAVGSQQGTRLCYLEVD